MFSKMLCRIEINLIIRDWHYKMWLLSEYGPECAEYSGNSLKNISIVVKLCF